MIGLNLDFTENTLGYSLVAIGDSDKPLIVNAVRVVVSLLGNLFLIPGLGFVGAALASIVGNLAAIPLDILFLSRRKIVAGIRDYLKPVMVFGACGLVLLFIGSSLGLFRVAIVGLYGMTCLLVSAIRVQDLAAVSKEVSISLSKLLRRHRLSGLG
jgi:O-antigen/teichoic acid export membrane protein